MGRHRRMPPCALPLAHHTLVAVAKDSRITRLPTPPPRAPCPSLPLLDACFRRRPPHLVTLRPPTVAPSHIASSLVCRRVPRSGGGEARGSWQSLLVGWLGLTLGCVSGGARERERGTGMGEGEREREEWERVRANSKEPIFSYWTELALLGFSLFRRRAL